MSQQQVTSREVILRWCLLSQVLIRSCSLVLVICNSSAPWNFCLGYSCSLWFCFHDDNLCVCVCIGYVSLERQCMPGAYVEVRERFCEVSSLLPYAGSRAKSQVSLAWQAPLLAKLTCWLTSQIPPPFFFFPFLLLSPPIYSFPLPIKCMTFFSLIVIVCIYVIYS